jgi:hypothetical protein
MGRFARYRHTVAQIERRCDALSGVLTAAKPQSPGWPWALRRQDGRGNAISAANPVFAAHRLQAKAVRGEGIQSVSYGAVRHPPCRRTSPLPAFRKRIDGRGIEAVHLLVRIDHRGVSLQRARFSDNRVMDQSSARRPPDANSSDRGAYPWWKRRRNPSSAQTLPLALPPAIPAGSVLKVSAGYGGTQLVGNASGGLRPQNFKAYHPRTHELSTTLPSKVWSTGAGWAAEIRKSGCDDCGKGSH